MLRRKSKSGQQTSETLPVYKPKVILALVLTINCMFAECTCYDTVSVLRKNITYLLARDRTHAIIRYHWKDANRFY